MGELSRTLRPLNKLGRFNRPQLLGTTPKTSSGGKGRLRKCFSDTASPVFLREDKSRYGGGDHWARPNPGLLMLWGADLCLSKVRLLRALGKPCLSLSPHCFCAHLPAVLRSLIYWSVSPSRLEALRGQGPLNLQDLGGDLVPRSVGWMLEQEERMKEGKEREGEEERERKREFIQEA